MQNGCRTLLVGLALLFEPLVARMCHGLVPIPKKVFKNRIWYTFGAVAPFIAHCVCSRPNIYNRPFCDSEWDLEMSWITWGTSCVTCPSHNGGIHQVCSPDPSNGHNFFYLPKVSQECIHNIFQTGIGYMNCIRKVLRNKSKWYRMFHSFTYITFHSRIQSKMIFTLSYPIFT